MIVSAAWNKFLRYGPALVVSSLPIGSIAFAVWDLPRDGRPAAPIPGNPDHYYERRIVRRTVPFDPARVESEWFPVADALGPDPEIRGAWDATGVRFAIKRREATDIRVDIDREGDGFDRGTANYRFQFGFAGDAPRVRRWDGSRGGAEANWKEVEPSAEPRFLVSSDWLLVWIPAERSVRRTVGTVGLRVSTAAAKPFEGAPGAAGFMAMELVEDVPAAGNGLTVRLNPVSRLTSDDKPVRAQLEIANVSGETIAVEGGKVEGPAGAIDTVVAPVEIQPGARVRRDVQLLFPAGDGDVAFAYEARVRTKSGNVAARTSIERIDPCAVELRLDGQPVPTIGPENRRQRLAQVVVRNRSDRAFDATVALVLPAGWLVDVPSKPLRLSFNTEVKGLPFKFTVPEGTRPGRYSCEAVVTGGRRILKAQGVIEVVESR